MKTINLIIISSSSHRKVSTLIKTTQCTYLLNQLLVIQPPTSLQHNSVIFNKRSNKIKTPVTLIRVFTQCKRIWRGNNLVMLVVATYSLITKNSLDRILFNRIVTSDFHWSSSHSTHSIMGVCIKQYRRNKDWETIRIRNLVIIVVKSSI
jgi:hypothetical protein